MLHPWESIVKIDSWLLHLQVNPGYYLTFILFRIKKPHLKMTGFAGEHRFAGCEVCLQCSCYSFCDTVRPIRKSTGQD